MAYAYYEIIEMILPLFFILVPALMVYSYLMTTASFVGGALIGIAVGWGVNIITDWMVTVAIICLVALIFFEQRYVGEGGGY